MGTLALRAGPGLINLAALLIVAQRLSTTDYGLYSTVVATGGFVASVTFGIFYSPIISQYPLLATPEARGSYLGAAVIAAGAVSGLVFLFGGLALALLGLEPVLIAVVLVAGAHALLQEFARARLQVWAYVASDFIQACGFLGALLAFEHLSYAGAAALFSLSYVPAILFSALVVLRGATLTFAISDLRRISRPGKWLVLSTLAENLLFLGSRYVLLAFGATSILGTFSIALDLAQRSVGFVINATSFLYQPKAFAALAKSGDDAFRAVILRGGLIAVALGALAIGAVAAIASWSSTRSALPAGFEFWAFAVLAGAVIINRLKKLILDPFAMRDGRTRSLMVCTAAGSGIGLASVAGGLHVGWTFAAPLAYALGYIATAMLTAILLKNSLLSSGFAERGSGF